MAPAFPVLFSRLAASGALALSAAMMTADARLSRWHATAKGLLRLMEFRGLDSGGRNDRLQAWAKRFAAGEPARADVVADLREFEALMDAAFTDDDGKRNWDRHTAPLLDWIGAFQCGLVAESPCLDHARKRWRETHAAAWAVAVAENLPSDQALPRDVAAAMRRWPRSQPGYAYARFYLARNAYTTLAALPPGSAQRAVKTRQLRQELDRLQAMGRAVYPQDSRYLLQNLRVPLARTQDEFRAGLFYEKTARDKADQIVYTAWPALAEGLSAATLWTLAQDDTGRHDAFRATLESVALCRALALAQHEAAKDMIRQIFARHPRLASRFAPYLDASGPERLREESMMLLATHPGLAFGVSKEFGGWEDILADPEKLPVDDLRPFPVWWWSDGLADASELILGSTDTATVPAAARAVMPEAARQFGGGNAAQEAAALRRIGNPRDRLGKFLLGYAKSHPHDPRVPVALHLLILSNRLVSDNDEAKTPGLSRALFRLMHRQYRGGKWARATPYYY